MEARDLLVVMAKKPVPGAVKTRLAAALGDEAACDLYRAFLCDLEARLDAGSWGVVWAVHPEGSDLANDIGVPVECIDQHGADLGERMRNCFADLFARPSVARVVMIGVDLPHLPIAVLERAFAALVEADAVLVPTRDGGYGLVGLRRPLDLFSGIETGTPTVRRETLERARAYGLNVALLDETFDVDELDDLRSLDALIVGGGVDLPFTAAVLARASVRARL